MDRPHTLPAGLTCTPFKLGPSAPMIQPIIQTTVEDLTSRACEHPTSLDLGHPGTRVQIQTELVRISISDNESNGQDYVPDVEMCHNALEYIVSQCYGAQRVWGGGFNDVDGGVTYKVTYVPGAEKIVAEMESLQGHARPTHVSGASPAWSGMPSGIASGFPEQSGVASGVVSLPAIMPTNSFHAIPPAYTYGVPSGYPETSGVVATGYVSGSPWGPRATPVVPADVMPGSKGYPTFDKREAGADIEEKRPRMRWISG